MKRIIRIDQAPPYTRKKFQAYTEEWDLDSPIGYGDTIQEALEDFIESWELRYDVTPKYTWK